MKKKSTTPIRIASTVMLLVALTLFSTGASASVRDFVFGQVAHEGTELHALAITSLEQNGGSNTYFTNGKGRILDVQAKKCDDGRIRASVQRVYIPQNYISGSYDGTKAIEATYTQLHELAEQGDKVGEYTMVPTVIGANAFSCGASIAMALDSE